MGSRSASTVLGPPRCTRVLSVTPSLAAPRLVAIPLEGAAAAPSPTQGTSKRRRHTFSVSEQRGSFASPKVPAEEDSL